MEKLFNIPVELFRLEKLLINKQKVCKVHYVITDTRGDKNVEFTGTVQPNYQCTEALELKLNDLKPYLCDIVHIEPDQRQHVTVSGIEMSGLGENATFKIHGVQISESEQAMRFSTCKIHYDGSYYGFEVDDVKAKAAIFDLENVQSAADGTIVKEDRKDPKQQADVLDTLRYLVNLVLPDFDKLYMLPDKK